MKKIAESEESEIYDWEPNQVVKLYRNAKEAPRLEYEAKIARMLKGTGLPFPEVKGLVEIDGRRGIVFEYIQGPTLKKFVSSSPWALIQSAQEFADLHAEIHKHILPDLPPLKTELGRLIEESTTLPRELQRAALAVLHKLSDDTVLCHGDFHLNNVIISSSRLIVLDWERACRGNPLADVAKTSLFLRLGLLPANRITSGLIQSARLLFQQVYLNRYFRIHPSSRRQVEDWQLPVGAAFLNRTPTVFTGQLLEFLERLLYR